MTIGEGSRMQRSTPATFTILLFIFYEMKLIRDMMQQNLTLKCNFEDVLPLLCELDMCVLKALRWRAQVE